MILILIRIIQILKVVRIPSQELLRKIAQHSALGITGKNCPAFRPRNYWEKLPSIPSQELLGKFAQHFVLGITFCIHRRACSKKNLSRKGRCIFLELFGTQQSKLPYLPELPNIHLLLESCPHPLYIRHIISRRPTCADTKSITNILCRIYKLLLLDNVYIFGPIIKRCRRERLT